MGKKDDNGCMIELLGLYVLAVIALFFIYSLHLGTVGIIIVIVLCIAIVIGIFIIHEKEKGRIKEKLEQNKQIDLPQNNCQPSSVEISDIIEDILQKQADGEMKKIEEATLRKDKYEHIQNEYPHGYNEWYENLPANKATNCIEWAVKEEQIIKQLEQDYLAKLKKKKDDNIAREKQLRKQQEKEKLQKLLSEYNHIISEYHSGFLKWRNSHPNLSDMERMNLAIKEKDIIIQLEEEHLKGDYDRIVEQYPHGWHKWERTIKKDEIESFLCLVVKNEKIIKQLEDEWQAKEKKIREEQEEAPASKEETLSRYDEMNEIRSEYDNEKLIKRLGFHYGYTPYYYFYDYYPQNHYPNLSSRNMKIRKSIYAFKDCKPNNWANIMTAKIRWIFSNKLNKIVFVCIPASTQETTQRRYKIFMEQVCQKTGMLNGYDYVRITKEGEARHLGGENEGDYECDKDFFEDRFVIVFDDIFTRGDSLRKMRTKLERVGAQVIAAFFLGKTVRRDEFKESKVHPWEVDIVNPQQIQIRSIGYDEDGDEEERDIVEA